MNTESTALIGEVLDQMPQAMPAANPYLSMIETMIERGGDLANLDKILDLQIKWEANEARKAFNTAFASFKAEAIKVIKGTEIKDGPLKGKMHANLHDVVVATAAPLAKFGLTTAWKLTKDEPTSMEVTCVLKHSAGHSETVSMSAAPDTGPGRNAIQARGSAMAYLERYTLMAILGLAASEQDNDGNATEGKPAELITEEQEATLRDMIEASGADKAAFLKYANIDRLADMKAAHFNAAKKVLNQKLATAEKKQNAA